MNALLLAITAALASPAIVVLLLLSWRFSWLSTFPSLPWMLAAIGLSAWVLFVIKRLSVFATKRCRFAADKIGVVLVGVGILWMAFLWMSSASTFKMERNIGTVESVADGRARVLLKGINFSTEFPQFDNFCFLRQGETVQVLQESKTMEILSRTYVFTGLGTAVGFLLTIGGYFAPRIRHLSPEIGSSS